MGPHLGCGDALCASGCSFSYRCRARVSLVMTHGYQPVTPPRLCCWGCPFPFFPSPPRCAENCRILLTAKSLAMYEPASDFSCRLVQLD